MGINRIFYNRDYYNHDYIETFDCAWMMVIYDSPQ
jgi:hypothetical protein